MSGSNDPVMMEQRRPLNISYVLPVYWPMIGGCENHVRELALRLGHRHHIRIVTAITSAQEKSCGSRFAWSVLLAAPARTEPYADGNTQITKVAIPPPLKAFMFLLLRIAGSIRMPAWMRETAGWFFIRLYKQRLRNAIGAPDLIHGVHGDVSWMSRAALELAHEIGIPFVFTPASHIYSRDKAVAGTYAAERSIRLADVKRVLQHPLDAHFLPTCTGADMLFAMTDAERDFFKTSGINSKAETVGSGPVLAEQPAADVRRRFGIPETSPVVLFLGRVNRDKGVPEILASAPLVWKHCPDTVFLFVGPTEWGCEELFTSTRDTRVVLAGPVDLATKSGAIKTCDILCVPSLRESLGAVYLEAWAFRKPVIGANIPPFRELTGEGRGGLPVEPTPEAVAGAIVGLLQNPERAGKMGAWGHERLLERFNWDRIAKGAEDAYDALIRPNENRS